MRIQSGGQGEEAALWEQLMLRWDSAYSALVAAEIARRTETKSVGDGQDPNDAAEKALKDMATIKAEIDDLIRRTRLRRPLPKEPLLVGVIEPNRGHSDESATTESTDDLPASGNSDQA